MAYRRTRYSVSANTKWYSFSREDWKKFIDLLYTIQKPQVEMTAEEVELWNCYYIAKDHGRNEKGLFELPYIRWQRVHEAIK